MPDEETIFKPASPDELKKRRMTIIKEWVNNFELKEGVTKNSDGSYDVKGDLDLSKDDLGPDTALIQEHVKFNKIGGNFTVKISELFAMLPNEVDGNIHIIGNLRDDIEEAGCQANGQVIVTLNC
jgi:hypothetical protein